MPTPTLDEQIAQAKQNLNNWDQYAPQIDRVRELERGTKFTPIIDRMHGYFRLNALQGYGQLVSAYQTIGDLTPEQGEKMSRVAKVINGLEQDQIRMGDQPTPQTAEWHAEMKMHELAQNGETYILSGHKKHFNITRIRKLPDGNYSYTLYDAGHEAKVVRWEDGRPVQVAVQENIIKPGTDIAKLIAADAMKMGTESDSADYKKFKKTIEGSLKDPPIREDIDYGQRKGNCTTRGQRIMAADIMQDPALSENFYEFASGTKGTSRADVRQALQDKIEYLEGIRDSGSVPPKSWKPLELDKFAAASDPASYQYVKLSLDGGGAMDAYRTTPGLFNERELLSLQAQLKRNGVEAAVRESIASPGQHYLYVPQDQAAEIQKGLQRDISPEADLVRRFGPRAPERVAAENFVKSANPDNYEHKQIPVDDKNGRLDVYRTKPGAFDKPQLEDLQAVLKRNGQPSMIKESLSSPGKYFLYVPEEDTKKVHAALAADKSPAADLYRRFGVTAPGQIPAVPPPLPEPPPLPQNLKPPPLPPDVKPQPEVQPQPPPLPLPPKLLKPLKPESLMALGVWREGNAGGTPVARMTTAGMDEAQISATLARLKDAGYEPALHNSTELGPTIRLAGVDALKLHDVRKQTLANAGWQEDVTKDGRPITRVSTANMTDEQVQGLKNALESAGLKPVERQSVSLGQTIRLEGDDVAKIRKYTGGGPVASPAAQPQGNAGQGNEAGQTLPPQQPPGQDAVKAARVGAAVIKDALDGNPPPETPPAPPASKFTAPPTPPAEQPVPAPVKIPTPSVTGRVIDGGMGAVGLVQGTMGAVHAAKEGDAAGVAVNGANAASGGMQVGMTVAESLGYEVAPVLKGVVGKANIGLTIGTGVYQIATEKGDFVDKNADGSHSLGNKGDRTVAVVATTGAGLGLAAAGVSTGGVVIAVAATAYVGEKAVEAHRARKEADQDIAANAVPKKLDIKLAHDDGGPSIYKFRHIGVALSEVSKEMKDDNMGSRVKRTPDGIIDLNQGRNVDMRDPKNIREFERALDASIEKFTKQRDANESAVPNWLRSGESMDKYDTARIYLASLTAAKTELGMYKQELADYNAAHPAEPPPDPKKPAGGKPLRTPRTMA